MKESLGNEGETVDRTHECGRWKMNGFYQFQWRKKSYKTSHRLAE